MSLDTTSDNEHYAKYKYIISSLYTPQPTVSPITSNNKHLQTVAVMRSFNLHCLAALSLSAFATASPCPYGDLAEKGLLPKREAAEFFAARAEGESAVEAQITARELKQREFAAQADFYKRQLSDGELSLGGGLVDGKLQPFTGMLSGLAVPV